MSHKLTCLFIGRFQPYHIGHHLVIQGMAKVCGKVIIGIGSSDKSHTAENPYTVQERKEMIQSTLQSENLIPMFDISFLELPDQKNDESWANHVLELSGPIDAVWTGNDAIKKCFEGKVIVKNIKEVPGINSTEIRQMIKAGSYWEEKVPDDIARAIKEIGIDRIK